MPTGETILLVEDEPSIRMLMRTVLESEGYRVIEARNGHEALDRFNGTVDLLLTDIRLPHIDGHAVIDLLRQRRRSLRVLAISAYPLTGPAEEVPFLSKPFTHEALLHAVRAVLRGSEQA